MRVNAPLKHVYLLQCFTRKYVRYEGIERVNSSVLPQPRDRIFPWIGQVLDNPLSAFFVFDVSHSVQQCEAIVIVSAVEGDFQKRRYRLSENGYIDKITGAEGYRYDADHLYPGVEWLEKQN
jgi:hypothetical protein